MRIEEIHGHGTAQHEPSDRLQPGGRYGARGEPLADGTTLVRKVIFDPLQASLLDADTALASWARRHRRLARALDLTGRGIVLALGLALGWSVLAGGADQAVAAIAAVALFLAPDLLARLGRGLRARRETALSRLAMADFFQDHAAPWLAALSPTERARCYRRLLLRGEALLLGVRAQLIRSEAGAAHLLLTTIPRFAPTAG
jgi:hypothetical protein